VRLFFLLSFVLSTALMGPIAGLHAVIGKCGLHKTHVAETPERFTSPSAFRAADPAVPAFSRADMTSALDMAAPALK
jgi:hypothetical protein